MVKLVNLFRNALSKFASDSDEKASDFYLSSWQRDDWALPLLLVRVICLATAVATVSWTVYEASNPYWLIFLTNWGMLLVTLMFLAAVVVSFSAVTKNLTDSDQPLPWYVNIYWTLYNVAIGLAFVITALYWILLFSPTIAADTRHLWMEVLTHAGNSILVLVEVLASRTPLRPIDVYQPIVFGLWYVAFTAIYYIAGGTDGVGNHFIYDLLDWKHTYRTLGVVFMALVFMILLYFGVYGIAVGRDKLSKKFFRTTTLDLTAHNLNYQIPPFSNYV